MADVIVYDKAKYHYAGDFPNGLAIKYAFVHTGMFLGWIVDHDLFSEEFEEDSMNEIEKFKQRALTGTQIYEMWDGVLSEDMLSDEGMEFANDYFDFEKGMFLHDYEATFPGKESLYFVEDTWENYFKIKEVIDQRYHEWRLVKVAKNMFQIVFSLINLYLPTLSLKS